MKIHAIRYCVASLSQDTPWITISQHSVERYIKKYFANVFKKFRCVCTVSARSHSSTTSSDDVTKTLMLYRDVLSTTSGHTSHPAFKLITCKTLLTALFKNHQKRKRKLLTTTILLDLFTIVTLTIKRTTAICRPSQSAHSPRLKIENAKKSKCYNRRFINSLRYSCFFAVVQLTNMPKSWSARKLSATNFMTR